MAKPGGSRPLRIQTHNERQGSPPIANWFLDNNTKIWTTCSFQIIKNVEIIAPIPVFGQLKILGVEHFFAHPRQPSIIGEGRPAPYQVEQKYLSEQTGFEHTARLLMVFATVTTKI